jgi:alpha-tubulin suppressor-like RCC1 family protein
MVEKVLAADGRGSLTRVSTNASILVPMTEDAGLLRSAIDSELFVANGWTSLYDGVRMGNETIQGSAFRLTDVVDGCAEARKAGVVVFTDGRENNSSDDNSSSYDADKYPGDGVNTTLEDLYGLAVDGVTTPVYIVGLGDDVDHAAMQSLSEQTGGRYLAVDSADELDGVFGVVGDYFQGGYRVCAELPATVCGELTIQADYEWLYGDSTFTGQQTEDVFVSCPEKRISSISAGRFHTCSLRSDGAVRCKVPHTQYNLMLGNGGRSTLPVDLGGAAVQITSGYEHACALMDDGSVRCWGAGFRGRLGYGNEADIGFDVLPSQVGSINLGGVAVQIDAGVDHTCAVMNTGRVRCWGANSYGQLGYGHRNHIGDNESPASAGDVELGARAVSVSAGAYFTCALLEEGNLRCWGRNYNGRLGLGNESTPYPGRTKDVGDDELPTDVPLVNVGGPVVQVYASNNHHACVVLVGGTVRCWGYATNGYGRLGYGNDETIGDNEAPADVGDVSVGAPVKKVIAGGTHTCALLTSGGVRCWGQGGFNGFPANTHIGDDEFPSAYGELLLSAPAVDIVGSIRNTCAILSDDTVTCWGSDPGVPTGADW